MQKLPLKVMIIGAGTSGLALAHGLNQAGIEVIVFERDRMPRDAKGGYRVGISPGGSQALKTCLPPELFELFLATSARPPRYFNMLTEHFSNLISLEMEEDDPAHGEQNVNRLTLRRVLLTGLEDVVRFDKKFVRYEEATDGAITVFSRMVRSAVGTFLSGQMDLALACAGKDSQMHSKKGPAFFLWVEKFL
jgi:2-polyprenyl-6-methoxyphenol hydroxylase-like FAD-dependent oxidoreductase